MEIFLDLISYFGINLIEEAETFPELLQRFLYSLFALYLIVFVFRAFFTAVWKIKSDLSGR